MSSNRDMFRNVAEGMKPAATKAKKPKKKRAAPTPRLSKEQAAQQQRLKKKATAWKLHPDTKPAIDRAASEFRVSRGELVDFLLRAGLFQLATGKIKLPLRDNEGGAQFSIDAPPIPDAFLGVG